MKSLYQSMMLVAAAAMSLTACTNDTTEDIVIPAGSGATKTITVTTDITRTEFADAGRTHLAWSANDKFGVFTDAAADKKNIEVSTADGSTFSSLTVDAAATTVYAYYPLNTYSSSADKVRIDIPQKQTQTAAGVFNGAYMPMIATGTINSDNSVALTFKPVACALALNICNGQEGETVTEVTFTTASDSASDSENCSGYDSGGNDITVGADKFSYKGYRNSVTLTVGNDVTIPADGIVENKQTFANQIYMVVAKKNYSAGAKFVVKTTLGSYTFTTTKNIDCTANDFMPITLDLTKGVTPPKGTWEQVTALSDITEGTYVIVNHGSYLPSTKTNSSPVKKLLADANVTVGNGTLAGTITEEMRWYFTGTNSAMYIKNLDGDYLSANNESKGVRVGSTSDTWRFEINNTGFAAQEKNNKRYVATFSDKDWRSYTSKSNSGYNDNGILYLYKFKEESAPEPTTPYIAVNPVEAPIVGEEAGMSATAYEVRNSESAAEVTGVDGTVVTEALIDSDGLSYVVSPNYTGAARTGSITLALADDPSVTATINVSQAADVFTVDNETVALGNTAEAASAVKIKVNSSYPWTITVPENAGYTVDPTSYDGTNTTGVKTVTITPTAANAGAEAVDLGSFTITRTTDDTDTNKTKTVAVMQNGASAAAQLPFVFNSGKSEIGNTPGMSQNGLGNDYNHDNHSPYVLKFDSANDYIAIHIAKAAQTVSFEVKMVGGNISSTLSVMGSIDGENYEKIQDFTTTGDQNDIFKFSTTSSINASYRYIKIEMTQKGSNVGVGNIKIE